MLSTIGVDSNAAAALEVDDAPQQLILNPSALDVGVSHNSDHIDYVALHADHHHHGTTAVQQQPIRLQIYWQRWYVAIAYSFALFANNWILNMFGPIEASMACLLGWHGSTVPVLTFYGSATSLLFLLPASHVVARLSLRKYLCIATGSLAIPMVLRCIPLSSKSMSIVGIHLSSLVMNIGSSGIMLLPPILSNVWFPPQEWNTALAIVIFLPNIGFILPFLVGPIVVPQPSSYSQKVSNLSEIQIGYDRYTYMLTALACLAFLCVVVYFPEAPTTPPSVSAATQRTSIADGFKTLLRNRDFWPFALRTLFISSVGNSIAYVISIYYRTKYIDQSEAGWIGFWIGLAVIVAGFFTGALADKYGHLKLISIAWAVVALEGATWIFFIELDLIPASYRSIYASQLIYAVAAGACSSIMLELTCQVCYPVTENSVACLLGIVGNIQTCCFTALMFKPELALDWIDWYRFVSTVLGLFVSITLPEKYQRNQMEYY